MKRYQRKCDIGKSPKWGFSSNGWLLLKQASESGGDSRENTKFGKMRGANHFKKSQESQKIPWEKSDLPLSKIQKKKF